MRKGGEDGDNVSNYHEGNKEVSRSTSRSEGNDSQGGLYLGEESG